MHGLNRIFILGHLGNVPQIYSTKNGGQYAGLSIATHRVKASDDGDKETTDWHFVRVWGKQAETCAKYLSKGQAVMVEGYLTHYSLSRDNGETERRVGINALKVDFLPRANAPATAPAEPH